MQPLESIHSWTKGTLSLPYFTLPYPTTFHLPLPCPTLPYPTLPFSTYPYPTLPPTLTLPYPFPLTPTLLYPTLPYPFPLTPTLPYPLPSPYPTLCPCPAPTPCPCPTPLPYLHITKPVAVELCCHATALILYMWAVQKGTQSYIMPSPIGAHELMGGMLPLGSKKPDQRLCCSLNVPIFCYSNAFL